MRNLLAYIITLSISVSGWTASPDTESSLNEQLANSNMLIIEPGAPGSLLPQVTVTEVADSNEDRVIEIIDQLPSEKAQDILISTDSEGLIEKSLSVVENKNTRLRFMPLGHLLSQKTSAFVEKVSAYKDHVVESIKRDKLGLVILTVNTAYDSFLWIHATSLSVDQRAAQVIMNTILAVAFGLDKDMWTKMTRPLEGRILNSLEKFGGLSTGVPGRMNAANVASKFFSNLAFSIGFQVLRHGIISLEHLNAALSSTSFWIASASIGALMTASGFAWSEQLANVDEAKYPIAKTVLRRFMDFRMIVLGHLAPISKVLQPQVYGQMPMVTLAIHGALGLVAMLRSAALIRFLENSQVAKYIYLVQKRFEQLITLPTDTVAVQTAPQVAPLCRTVFQ